VDFVDDVDFELSPHRADADGGAKLSDVVDPAIGGAVDFHDIHVIAGGDSLADIALVAGDAVDGMRAVESFGEDAGSRRFADTAGSGEHVGVSHSSGANGVAESF
jgi:hypothetical protein